LFNIGNKSARLLLYLESPDALVIENIIYLLQGPTTCFLKQEESVQGGDKAESTEDAVQLDMVRALIFTLAAWVFTFH